MNNSIKYFLLVFVSLVGCDGSSYASISLDAKEWADESLYKGENVNLRGRITPLNQPVNAEAYKFVLRQVTQNNNLQELDVSENKLNAESMKILVPVLKEKPSLRKIIMQNCDLESFAFMIFSNEILANNTSLTYADFSRNKIGAWPFVDLSKTLSNNSLQYLDFSSNPLGADVAPHIYSLLAQNQGLRTLKLSSVGLDYHAIREICDGLNENTTLRELDLSKNVLGELGGNNIVHLIASHSKLETLDISDCQITDTAINDILCAWGKNNTLTTLKFRQKDLSSNTAQLWLNKQEEKEFSFDEKNFVLKRVAA